MNTYDDWLKKNNREGTKDDYIDFLVEVEGYTYSRAVSMAQDYEM